jgi:ankyrin repeat protein
MMAARGNHAEAARVLLKNGADPNMRNEWGKTALDWAMSKKNEDLAALLKSSGARE